MRRRFAILVIAALALLIPATAGAQTISNYNNGMVGCLQGKSGYFRSQIVPYHTTYQPLLWWTNQVYGVPYFDAYPGGGGDVQFWETPGGEGHSYYMSWTYKTNANGTILHGSQGYVYITGTKQAWLNSLVACYTIWAVA